jgi:hypothetical protein
MLRNSQPCPQCQAAIEAPEPGLVLRYPSCGSILQAQRLRPMLRIPLTALTAVILGLSYLIVGSRIASALPPGSDPNIVFMAPTLG